MLDRRPVRYPVVAMRRARVAAALLLCVALAGCALHWPWRHRKAPAPQPVAVLSIEPRTPQDGASAAQITQFWDRNTLLLDLRALHGEGEVTLRPDAARGWPIRLELRVQPGAIAQLEAVGSARVVFEVPASGKTLLLHLAPDVYERGTPAIIIRWSAAADSAH